MTTAETRSRRPILLALVIALSVAAPPLSGEEPRIQTSTSVYDAEGVRLGEPVLSSDRWFSLLPLRFAGGIYLLTVHSRYIMVDGGILFESSDCSGQAYVETATSSGQPTMWGTATILPPGWTLWAPDPASEPISIDAASGISGFTGCGPRNVSLEGHPASPLVDLEQVLKPPFLLQLDPLESEPPDLANMLEKLGGSRDGGL